MTGLSVVNKASKSLSDNPFGCSADGCSFMRSTTLTTRTFTLGKYRRNKETASYLVDKGLAVLRAMGGEDPRAVSKFGGASTNLVGGTCRFGTDPARSVLDADCRAHEAENLFVTDGSFMPSGGSVPPTFTIYANALRVGEKIVAQLGGDRR